MKIKNLRLINMLLLISLVLISTTYADSNGVWHFARDVVPGIFGADEDGANPLINFTFISKVFFEATVDLGADAIYKGQELDTRYVNTNGDSMSGNLNVNGKITTNAVVTDNNQLATKEYVDNRVNAGGGSSGTALYEAGHTYYFNGGFPYFCSYAIINSIDNPNTIINYNEGKDCLGNNKKCHNGQCVGIISQTYTEPKRDGLNLVYEPETARQFCKDNGFEDVMTFTGAWYEYKRIESMTHCTTGMDGGRYTQGVDIYRYRGYWERITAGCIGDYNPDYYGFVSYYYVLNQFTCWKYG